MLWMLVPMAGSLQLLSEQLRQVVVSHFCELVVQYKHLGSWQGINKRWTSPIA